MTVLKREVCRSYYHDVDDHSFPGLRSVDWALFVRALREWMASDPYAQFEGLLRAAPGGGPRRVAADAAGASGARGVVVDVGQLTRVPRRASIFCSACSRYCLKTG